MICNFREVSTWFWRIFFLLISTFCGVQFSYAGGKDSVAIYLEDESLHDTTRIRMAVNYLMKMPASESERVFSDLASISNLALQKGFPKFAVYALNARGYCANKYSKYGQAVMFFKEALSLAEKQQEIIGEMSALKHLGDVYILLADYNKSIEMWQKLLKYIPKHKHPLATFSIVYNNLGKCYEISGDLARANVIYQKALAASINENDKQKIAFSYSNLANIMGFLNKYDSSLYYHKLCIEIRQSSPELGASLLFSYNDLAEVLDTLGRKKEAFDYMEKAYHLAQKTNEKWITCVIGLNFARLYFEKNDFVNSQKIAEKGLADGMESGVKQGIKMAHGLLYEIANKQKNFELALKHYRLERIYADSISEANKATELANLSQNLDLIDKEKQNEILLQKAANQQIIIISSLAGIFFLFLLLFLLLRNNKRKQKANLLLEKQKAEISQKSHEISQIAESLNIAYLELDNKNKDTLASIQYAKRIQEALMPSDERLKAYLKDYFIFYQPKDIVSGDFYWFANTTAGNLLVVADCTGHGVPGALMSVIGVNLLNDIVIAQGVFQPADILNQLHKAITKMFSRDAKNASDSMDIALVLIAHEQQKISFAAAMSPAVLVLYPENSPNSAIMLDLEANKLPIGSRQANEKIYTQQDYAIDFSLFVQNEKSEKNTTVAELFLFSDGFKDQFGGENSKKYLSKNFKNYLFSLKTLPTAEQAILLKKEFENWKGTQEKQTDDVLVFGVKLLCQN